MKIQISDFKVRRRQAGNALLFALLIAAAVVPLMIGYLDAVRTQHRSVIRSQTWNSDMPLIEAGIEEALAHLNRNCYSNEQNAGVVDWAADGWANTATGVYQAPRRQFGDSYYDVQILTGSPVSTNTPDIVCVAHSPSLLTRSAGPMFAQVGQTTTSQQQTNYVARQVRVETSMYYIFAYGMLAKGIIEWKGNILLNSFDSGDSTKSNNGVYDYRFATDEAPIASLNSNVMLNGGIVYGTGETGPNGYITNGTLGDAEWVTNHPGQIDPSAVRNDLNRDLRDTKLPTGADSWPTLPYCGCTQSVTNPIVETTQLTSQTYPSPVPPGGVTTNRTGYVTGETNYPTWGGAYVVRTNNSTDIWATLPATMPTGYTVISTNGATWQTNLLSQGYPTTYLPTPTLILQSRTNLTFPASGTYDGTVTSNKIKGKWNYFYNEKIGWAYQIPSSYTVQFPTYDVETRTYTYTGSQTNYQVTTSTYAYVATAGKYQIGNLSLSGQNQMLVKAPGTTTLYITGNLSMAGQSQIFIERGASLVIYLAGNASLKGNGVANDNNTAVNFQIWGLPTCTDIDLGGNAAFTGTIYAPQAAIHAGGGGNDGYDLVGSIVGNTIKFNGHFKMHYDTALGRSGPSDGFFADRWQEEVVGKTR